MRGRPRKYTFEKLEEMYQELLQHPDNTKRGTIRDLSVKYGIPYQSFYGYVKSKNKAVA